ncbi:MAG: diacylglycerol kinase family protein [Candidatus Woesebacteria bacterium]|nr:MAG: diacylglycerol kinase family protein [Candidatus Woesebacteria bacterium]
MVSYRMEHRHSLLKSFRFAINGLKGVILQERNFKIQLFIGMLAVILGFALKLNLSEWLNLVAIITLVLILELVNTSIEEIVDLISPEFREKAKIAKDVAAACVLVASMGSIIIGALLFLPKLKILF